MSGEHGQPPASERSAVDWFAILDIAVWVSVVVIAGLAVEWFWGKVLRERLAGQAQEYLARVRATSGE